MRSFVEEHTHNRRITPYSRPITAFCWHISQGMGVTYPPTKETPFHLSTRIIRSRSIIAGAGGGPGGSVAAQRSRAVNISIQTNQRNSLNIIFPHPLIQIYSRISDIPKPDLLLCTEGARIGNAGTVNDAGSGWGSYTLSPKKGYFSPGAGACICSPHFMSGSRRIIIRSRSAFCSRIICACSLIVASIALSSPAGIVIVLIFRG